LSWLSAVSAFSLSAFQLLPKCGLGWLCPGFQGSRFRVQGSKFGGCHKLPKYNPPLPPPSGWSGGGLVSPWTYPGTIERSADPIFDQARLSKWVSSVVSALSPYSALDVGCWRFDVQVRRSPPVPCTPQNGLQVDHGGFDVAVPQQPLNGLEVVIGQQQVTYVCNQGFLNQGE